MGLHAFLAGANAVCFLKNNRKYGMICAWSTMIDYDVIGLLLGEQSVTSQNIEVGMIIGVSALAQGQKEVALQLGNGHSDVIDKFKSVPHTIKKTAILINDSKNNIVCLVEKILKLNDTSNDLFVVARFVESSEDPTKNFLEAEEVFR